MGVVIADTPSPPNLIGILIGIGPETKTALCHMSREGGPESYRRLRRLWRRYQQREGGWKVEAGRADRPGGVRVAYELPAVDIAPRVKKVTET
jgi:hypothetical protein